MNRFTLLLRNEFRLVRANLLVHALVITQPLLFFLLMASVMVHPTFDMHVEQPTTAEGRALVAAMAQVGSPIGSPYIHPVLVEPGERAGLGQVVRVEQGPQGPVAVQHFGLIDSNMVKNYRNRLTAAGLRLWNQALGSQAIAVNQMPWLPADVPYIAYYGLALLPLAALLAGTFIGGVQTAQDFELGTVLEYRLTPVSPWLIVASRLVRIVLWALAAIALLVVAIGLVGGHWPEQAWLVGLIALPVAVIAACVGMLAGLLLQRTLPTFVIALTASLGAWLLGGAFGLPAGFGGPYELLSTLSPVTYAVKLLFPRYYGIDVGPPLWSWLALLLFATVMVLLTVAVYRRQVQRAEA